MGGVRLQFMSRVGYHTAGKCQVHNLKSQWALLPNKDGICRSHPLQF